MIEFKIGDKVRIKSGNYYVGECAYICNITYNTPFAPLQNIYILSKFDKVLCEKDLGIYFIESELEYDKQWLREEKLKKILE